MKTTWIEDYAPGQAFRGLIVRRSCPEYKDAKNGAMCAMIVRDRSSVKASKFSLLPKERALIDTHEILEIDGHIQDKAGYVGDMVIEAIHPFAGEVLEEWFLPESHENDRTWFFRLCGSVRETNLKRLLDAVFTPDTVAAFSRAMAAQSRHHDYAGGLLEHTVEVARFADGLARRTRGVNRDLLVCAALLHDIGKLEEMEHEGNAGAYTLTGNLRGHLDLGRHRVEVAISTLPDFPPVLRDALVHLILSHHGRPEYGAAVKPKFLEAYFLAQCDLLSARAAAVRKAAKKRLPGEQFIEFSRREEDDIARHLYVGDFGLQPVVEEAEEKPMVFATRPAPEPIPKFQTRAAVLPVLGLVAAGSPEQGAEYSDETQEVVLPPGGADFLVRVTGDSMVDAGIRAGDLLLVKKTETPQDGQTVIASDPSAGQVVKALRVTSAGSVLESRNASQSYDPIPVTEDTQIQGVVVGMTRQFS